MSGCKSEEDLEARKKHMAQFRESGIASAGCIDLRNGKRIWIPPTGRPYWVGGPNAGPDLTDAEMAKYGISGK